MDQSKKYWVSTNQSIQKNTRDVLNEYLLSLKLSNKAEATITKYKSILEQFLTECNLPINLLTSDDVYQWIKKFSENKKEKTMDLVLSTLSSFFKF